MHPILSLIPTAQTDQTAATPNKSPKHGLRGDAENARTGKGTLIEEQDGLAIGLGDTQPAATTGKTAHAETFAKVLAEVAPARQEPTLPQPAQAKEAALTKGEVKPDAPGVVGPKRADILKSAVQPALEKPEQPGLRSQIVPDVKSTPAIPAADKATKTVLSSSKIILPNAVATTPHAHAATQAQTSLSNAPTQDIARLVDTPQPRAEVRLESPPDTPTQPVKPATADIRKTAVLQTARQPKEIVHTQAQRPHRVAGNVAPEGGPQIPVATKDTGPIPIQVPLADPSQRKVQSDRSRQEPSLKGISVSTPLRNAPQPLSTAFQTVPMPQITSETRRDTSVPTPALFDAEPLTGLRSEAPASTSSHLQAAPLRADLPQHMARQIAEVLQQMPARPVEISLSPEELGRVRLAMSSSEAGIVVSVLAERPETMDLLRRHIGTLESAFQHIGYDNVAFSFTGQGGADPEGQAQQDHATETIAMHDAPAPVEIALGTGVTSGLDIRL